MFVGVTRGMAEVHASCARMRDYRGTRRISAPSLFLTEMTGSETVVTGAESSGDDLRPPGPFEPDDDYSQLTADDPHVISGDDPRMAPRDPRRDAARPTREDGLVFEPEDGEPAPLGGRRDDRRRGPPKLATAAELDKRAGLARSAPPLVGGQRVRHAEYGEGTVAGVSGHGPRSVATVTFDGPAGNRRFIVSHGALEPL